MKVIIKIFLDIKGTKCFTLKMKVRSLNYRNMGAKLTYMFNYTTQTTKYNQTLNLKTPKIILQASKNYLPHRYASPN